MADPRSILDSLLIEAVSDDYEPLQMDEDAKDRLLYVCHCGSNRAAVRLLMACLLAKVDRPEIDPREPYTEIGSDGCFSGRTYDERFISGFIAENDLPCNPTTAFLTPALRNIDRPLSLELEIVGRPRRVYADAIALLDDVQLSPPLSASVPPCASAFSRRISAVSSG